MADNVTEVILRLRDEFSARLGKLEAQVGRTGEKIEKTFKFSALNVRAFGQNILSVANSVKALSDRFGSAAERVLNFSEQFGLTTDETQKLEFAAKLAGSELEALTPLLTRLATAQEKAGIKGQSLFASLQQVAKEFAAMPAGAEKAAASAELFGRGGTKLISTLISLQETSARAPIISEQQLKDIDKASDAITEFSIRLEKDLTPAAGFALNAVSSLIEGMQFAAKHATRGMMAGLGLGDIGADADAFRAHVKKQREEAEKAKEPMSFLAKATGEFGAAMAALAKGVGSQPTKPGSLLDDLLHGDEREKATAKRRQDIVKQIQDELQRRRKLNADSAKQEFDDRLAAEKKFSEDLAQLNEERRKKQEELDKHFAELDARFSTQGFVTGFTQQFDEVRAQLNDLHERGREIMSDLASTLGQALQSGFIKLAEDGFDSLGQKAREFVADVLRGLAQIAARQAAMAALGGFLGGAQNVAGLFAEGGMMRGSVEKTIPLRRFDRGGVAREPTLALVNERAGMKGEAFVPLPDGRSIPVQMRGGAGGGATQVNVSLSIHAVDARSVSDLMAQPEQKKVLKNLLYEAFSTDQGMRQRIKAVR